MADQKGFYRSENIEVELIPGGNDHNEIEMVASGKYDFRIVSAAQIISTRQEGKALVAIAVI